MSNSFADTSAEIYAKIQQRYDDMTPQILENEDEIADYNLYFVPEKTDGTPLLDTSHMTNTGNLFTDCRNLTHIALLDTSNVISMNGMFSGCVALSNESLNNILAMCTNSAMTSNKTLKYIGLSQTQVTTCQSLSNWSAFTNAGWTTGY